MKKIVKFTKAHQSYSVGDIAGFDPATADALISKKKVAEEYDAPEGAGETLAINVESVKARIEIARLKAEAKARSDELDAREAKVKEREDALAEAEKAMPARSDELDAREAALPDPGAADAGVTDADAAMAATSAKPPKQGGK